MQLTSSKGASYYHDGVIASGNTSHARQMTRYAIGNTYLIRISRGPSSPTTAKLSHWTLTILCPPSNMVHYATALSQSSCPIDPFEDRSFSAQSPPNGRP